MEKLKNGRIGELIHKLKKLKHHLDNKQIEQGQITPPLSSIIHDFIELCHSIKPNCSQKVVSELENRIFDILDFKTSPGTKKITETEQFGCINKANRKKKSRRIKLIMVLLCVILIIYYFLPAIPYLAELRLELELLLKRSP